MADLLDRTATAVRSGAGVTVHKLAEIIRDEYGRAYRTRCARVLTVDSGAVLSTYEVCCSKCLSPGMALTGRRALNLGEGPQ